MQTIIAKVATPSRSGHFLFRSYTTLLLQISILATKNLTITHSLTALRAGDRLAYEQLMDEYRQKVFNTAINMVQDHGAAEDITQEVFVTVFRSVGAFNEKSSLSTWIYRITVNKCLDHLRAQTRHKRSGIFGMLFKSNGEPLQDKPDFDHPGIQAERKEKARYLFAAIDTLAEQQKTAFILSHIEELPQKDIADIMNISIKAVESLLQRAKANLRKKLGDIYEGKKKE